MDEFDVRHATIADGHILIGPNELPAFLDLLDIAAHLEFQLVIGRCSPSRIVVCELHTFSANMGRLETKAFVCDELSELNFVLRRGWDFIICHDDIAIIETISQSGEVVEYWERIIVPSGDKEEGRIDGSLCLPRERGASLRTQPTSASNRICAIL